MVELLAQAGAGIARHGFDLTDFGSPEKFQMVLRENGLLASYRRITHRSSTDRTLKWYSFEWKNKRVKLITANNPLTGDSDRPGGNKERGYASYIGIEGEPSAVARVAASIKTHAKYIKDENPTDREYV